MKKIVDIAQAWHHNDTVLKAPKTAKADGPRISVRFRNTSELAAVQRAANSLNLSLNTYAAEVLSRAAQELLGHIIRVPQGFEGESKSATVHTADRSLQASSF